MTKNVKAISEILFFKGDCGTAFFLPFFPQISKITVFEVSGSKNKNNTPTYLFDLPLLSRLFSALPMGNKKRKRKRKSTSRSRKISSRFANAAGKNFPEPTRPATRGSTKRKTNKETKQQEQRVDSFVCSPEGSEWKKEGRKVKSPIKNRTYRVGTTRFEARVEEQRPAMGQEIHTNKNLGKGIVKGASIKSLAGIAVTCKCLRHNRKEGAECGCIDTRMLGIVKGWNMALQKKFGADGDPAGYKQAVMGIAECVQDRHRQCKHHGNKFRLPSFMKLKCEFHLEYFKKLLSRQRDSQVIHIEHGRLHTNACEGTFGTVWKKMRKGVKMSQSRFECLALIGVLTSNENAISQINGLGSGWRVSVMRSIGLTVRRSFVKDETKRLRSKLNRSREDPHTRALRKGRKKSHATARTRNATALKKALRLSSMTHTGGTRTIRSEKKPGVIDVSRLIHAPRRARHVSDLAVTLTDKPLIVLDVNGTLLYRRYNPVNRQYDPPTIRPHLSAFFCELRRFADVAIWTGQRTESGLRAVLSFLAPFGISYPKTVVGVHGSNDSHLTRGANQFNRDDVYMESGKRVYIKPLAVMREIYPMYKKIFLVDDEKEKSDGKGPKRKRILKNSSEEIFRVPSFGGNENDDALKPGGALLREIERRVALQPGANEFSSPVQSAEIHRAAVAS